MFSIARFGALRTTARDADARALINRMTVRPSRERILLIDKTVYDLKNNGVWGFVNQLYVLAAHNSQAALLNWKGNTKTAYVTGSPGFTVDQGFTASVSQLVSCDFDGVSDPLNCSQGQWTYCPDNGNVAHFGAFVIGSNQLNHYSNYFNNTTYFGHANRNFSVSDANIANERFRAISNERHPSVAQAYQRILYNGVVTQNTSLNDGVAIPAVPMGLNHAKHYQSQLNPGAATAQCQAGIHRMAFYGGKLDASQLSAFYTIMRNYMAALGIAVP